MNSLGARSARWNRSGGDGSRRRAQRRTEDAPTRRVVEPAETVVRLVPDETPLDLLMAEAVLRRPELAHAHETIKAAAYRLKQAKLRPFVPSLAVTYAGGGFGGG
jgi:outer membrane protein TolC